MVEKEARLERVDPWSLVKFDRKKMRKSPWMELWLMLGIIVISYIALALISLGLETPPGGMSARVISALLCGFFLLSTAIAILAVIVGIGGGVIFTPIMLAFTDVNSLIVRATGLVVAMFSGLISTGPFMRRGLGNMKICVTGVSSYGLGALLGASGAIWVAEHLGKTGEGTIRIILGIIVGLVVIYFLKGGKKIEYPVVTKTDRFTEFLKLSQPYYEESLGRVIDYKLTRFAFTMLALAGVGVLSGFFGMGGGWVATPAQNLIAGVPLKVAAANSGIILGMGDCIGVWPYIKAGAMIPLFAAPWLVGQVVGGLIGAYILIKVRALVVRYILTGILIATCFGLITKGLYMLRYIPKVPPIASLVVFGVSLAIFGYKLWKEVRLEGGE